MEVRSFPTLPLLSVLPPLLQSHCDIALGYTFLIVGSVGESPPHLLCNKLLISQPSQTLVYVELSRHTWNKSPLPAYRYHFSVRTISITFVIVM